MKHINQKQGFPAKADYDICNTLNFPNLRTLLISTSYNRHKRPIRHLATFPFKSDDSTPSTLEELKNPFIHDVQALKHSYTRNHPTILCICSNTKIGNFWNKN